MADLVQKIMKTAISVSGSSTRTLPALPSPAIADTSNRSAAGSNNNPKQLVVCRQWWKVCWVYGDQYKQGQKLYQAQKRILAKGSAISEAGGSSMVASNSNVLSSNGTMHSDGIVDLAVAPAIETDSGNDSASTTQVTPVKGPRRPCAMPRDQIPE